MKEVYLRNRNIQSYSSADWKRSENIETELQGLDEDKLTLPMSEMSLSSFFRNDEIKKLSQCKFNSICRADSFCKVDFAGIK